MQHVILQTLDDISSRRGGPDFDFHVITFSFLRLLMALMTRTSFTGAMPPGHGRSGHQYSFSTPSTTCIRGVQSCINGHGRHTLLDEAKRYTNAQHNRPPCVTDRPTRRCRLHLRHGWVDADDDTKEDGDSDTEDAEPTKNEPY